MRASFLFFANLRNEKKKHDRHTYYYIAALVPWGNLRTDTRIICLTSHRKKEYDKEIHIFCPLPILLSLRSKFHPS